MKNENEKLDQLFENLEDQWIVNMKIGFQKN